MIEKHINYSVAALCLDDILSRVVSLQWPGQVALRQKYESVDELLQIISPARY